MAKKPPKNQIVKNSDFANHGNSIWNQPFFDKLEEGFFRNIDITDISNASEKFLNIYPEWISSSKMNKFTGMEKFPYRFVSLGTTQGLDWWHYYCMANGLNLRMYRGEYPYNRDVLLEEEWRNKRFIDDTPLQKGDALIISLPFSGTGGKHDEWDDTMEICNSLGIPVFVDCAWFGTCHGLEVDLDQPCITMAAFSTTKGLSCGNWRSGIVFSRIDEGSLSVQTEWNHGIHLHTSIANFLFEHFTPDAVPKKYKDAHNAVCEHYGLTPSNTVHIAQAPMTKDWEMFHRDRQYHRVNIRDAVKLYKKSGTFND